MAVAGVVVCVAVSLLWESTDFVIHAFSDIELLIVLSLCKLCTTTLPGCVYRPMPYPVHL